MARFNTPSTVAEQNAYGNTLASLEFWASMLACFLFTIQFFMVFYGISAYISTPRTERRGRLRFILIGCFIFVTWSIDTFIDISSSLDILLVGGPTGRSYLDAIADVWEATYRKSMSMFGDSLLLLTIVAGDILMLWRCFILYHSHRWLVCLPFLTFVGSIAAYIVSLLPDALKANVPVQGVQSATAAACLHIATNILITSLILVRLQKAWFQIKRDFPEQKMPSMYSTVLTMIIESAAPLVVFGIGFITAMPLDMFNRPTNLVQRGRLKVCLRIFAWLYYGFCAISPQMIIFRVTTGKSWKSAAETYGGGTHSQPIQFAYASEGTAQSKGTA